MAQKKSSGSYKLQEAFIGMVRDILPPNLSLANELSELLEISQDSAYRRMRCETAMSIDEVVKVCQKYKIPFSPLKEIESDSITFHVRPLTNDDATFTKYLSDLLDSLKLIRKFPDAEIIYAAEEIPVFHHFGFPELMAFKFYYWNKEILNSDFTIGKKFSPSLIPPNWLKLGDEILNLYNQISSLEIWSENTINSTYKQIEFFWDSGLFESKELSMKVVDQFEKMVRNIEVQAENSIKSKSPQLKKMDLASVKFDLYRSDVTIGNNVILVKMNNIQATYISYHTMNFMTTTSAAFSDQTELWIKNLLKKATLISGVSEKYRYQFFKAKYESIAKLKEKIK